MAFKLMNEFYLNGSCPGSSFIAPAEGSRKTHYWLACRKPLSLSLGRVNKQNRKLVFVCTGNTCRSPMAEGLLKHLLGPDHGWDISSAGVCAGNGLPASPYAVEALRELGLDLSAHRSRRLTPQMIRRADLIVAMTAGHQHAVQSLVPESEGKVFLLKSFGVAQCAADIYDPVGESLDVYRRVRDEINGALPDLILYMMEERTGP